MNPWWQTLYDENLANLLLEPETNKEAQATLRFLQQQLGLQAGQKIFDQCCGTGRLALVLARDHTVLGIDLISEYIVKAKAKLEHAGLEAQFFCDDALKCIPNKAFDLALNWWTSFGYSKHDKVNLQMIRCAFSCLKSGGQYALDFMNVPGIYKHFQRDVMTSQQCASGKITLVRRSEINFENETLNKCWHYFIEGGKEIKHHSCVKLYSPAKLVQLFKQAGFINVRFYGGLNAEQLTLDSPRCIVVGQKP